MLGGVKGIFARKVGDADRWRAFVSRGKGDGEFILSDTPALVEEAGFEAVVDAALAAQSEVVGVVDGHGFKGEGWREGEAGF